MNTLKIDINNLNPSSIQSLDKLSGISLDTNKNDNFLESDINEFHNS